MDRWRVGRITSAGGQGPQQISQGPSTGWEEFMATGTKLVENEAFPLALQPAFLTSQILLGTELESWRLPGCGRSHVSSFFFSSPSLPLAPLFLPVFSAKPGARNAQDLNLFYLSWRVKIAGGKDVLGSPCLGIILVCLGGGKAVRW